MGDLPTTRKGLRTFSLLGLDPSVPQSGITPSNPTGPHCGTEGVDASASEGVPLLSGGFLFVGLVALSCFAVTVFCGLCTSRF